MSQAAQAIGLNLASPAFKANPYPTFTGLRASNPGCLLASAQGYNTWLVTRYAEAEIVLYDKRFVKDHTNVLSPEERACLPISPASAADLMAMSMIDFERMDHICINGPG